jgi:hypothetical protein
VDPTGLHPPPPTTPIKKITQIIIAKFYDKRILLAWLGLPWFNSVTQTPTRSSKLHFEQESARANENKNERNVAQSALRSALVSLYKICCFLTIFKIVFVFLWP